MKRVIGLGNALVDVLTEIEDEKILEDFALPKGSMQLVDADFSNRVLRETSHLKQTHASGGSAANTIHGLASLGVPVSFIGKVGKDEMGDFFHNDLKNHGINPKLIRTDKETGRAVAFITKDAERTFATYLGAAVELSADDITDALLKDYDYLHIEGYLVQNQKLLEHALKRAKALGLKVSLDLASYNVVEDNLDFLKEMVKAYVDILFANEEEAKAFTGYDDPEKSLNLIADIVDVAVVKIGKEGSLVKNEQEFYRIATDKVDSIDTTGAGDLYASGFLYGLASNLKLSSCGNIGSLLASKVIQGMGAKINSDKWDEILNKKKEFER